MESWQSILETFKELNGHPLYPLVASAQRAVNRYRREVLTKGKLVERIARSTGYNPWVRADRPHDKDKPPGLGDLSVQIGQAAIALIDMSAEIGSYQGEDDNGL